MLTLLLWTLLFLLGVALVIYCVEVFIEAVALSAVSLGISGFFLAVILAGVDLENAVLGVTAASFDLSDLALGTVFGEAIFVLAVAVGIAGFVVPFTTEVPRVYLAMLVLVPIPAIAMSLNGSIGRTEGLILLALFFPLLGFIYWKESRSETTYMLSGEVSEAVDVDELEGDLDDDVGEDDDDDDDDEGWDLDIDEFTPDLEGNSGRFNLGVALLAIVGLTIGSLITVFSSEAIFESFGISGLAFGATVLSFIASIEELALTVEPARRGQTQLAVGNVVGSTVFYVTANIGLIAVIAPVDTSGVVMTVHWPILGACLLVVAVMLARGRVAKYGGTVLLLLYVVYWIFNYL